jgi:hypothetical protein
MKKTLLLAAVLLALSGAVLAAVDKKDSFEDGDYTKDPEWDENQTTPDVSFSVNQDNGPPDGSYSVEAQTSGDNSNTAQTLQRYFPGKTTPTKANYTYYIWSDTASTSVQVSGVYMLGSGDVDNFIQMRVNDGGIQYNGDAISSENTVVSVSSNTWYEVKIKVNTDNVNPVNFSVYDTNGKFLGSATDDPSSSYDFQWVRMHQKDGKSTKVKVRWDLVTHDPDNDGPTFNYTHVRPDPVRFNDSLNYSAAVHDTDGTVSYMNLTAWKDGTKTVDNVKRQEKDGDGVYNWTENITVDCTNCWINASLTAEDNDGATTTDNIKRYISDKGPLVSLQDPQNITKFNYELTWNYSTTDDGDDVLNEDVQCTIRNDAQQIGQDTLKEGSGNTSDFRNAAGLHNVTVDCTEQNGASNSKNSTVWFSIDHYSLVSNNSSSPVLETQNVTYNGSWRLGDMVDGLRVQLWWNDTRRTDRNYTGSGVRYLNVSHYFRPPLVASNQTSETWKWNYRVNYTLEDGSRAQDWVNSSAQQEVWHAYIADSFNISKDRVIEAQDVPAEFKNYSLLNSPVATWNTSITYNGTWKIGNQATFWAYIIDTNSSSPLNMDTSGSGAGTISFRNRSYTRQAGTDTITVYNKVMTDCSGGNSTTLRFLVWDELNASDAIQADKVDYNLDITVLGRDTDNYAFQRSGHQVDTCLYPSWATYRASTGGPIEYDADNYTGRTYRLDNITLTKSWQEMNLYLLEDTKTINVLYEVERADGSKISGATVKTMRYFTGTNSFLTVSKAETDSQGIASTYLEPGVTYKWIITKNGKVLLATDKQTLVCENVPCKKSFTVDPEAVSEYFREKKGFTWNCFLNTGDPSFQCTVSHEDDTMRRANLLVEKNAAIGTSQQCNITVTNTGESMVCMLSNLSKNAYTYKLTGTKDGTTYLLKSGTIDRTKGMFAHSGNSLALVLMMILVVAGFGLYSPGAAIIFTTLGFVIAYLLGIFSIGIGALIGLIFLAILHVLEVEY